jgi:hypothetical protein
MISDDELEGVRRRVPLCCYSKAAGGMYTDHDGDWDGTIYEHQGDCPLGLTREQGRRCPCSRRQIAGAFEYNDRVRQVTVRTCTFPNLRDGTAIRSVEGLRRYILRKQA